MSQEKKIITLQSKDLTLAKMRELFTVTPNFIAGTFSGKAFVHHNISSNTPGVDYRISFSHPTISSPIINMGESGISLLTVCDIYGRKNEETGNYEKTESGNQMKEFLNNLCVFYAEFIDDDKNKDLKKKLFFTSGSPPESVKDKMNSKFVTGINEEDNSPIFNYNTFIPPISIHYDTENMEEEDKRQSPSFTTKVWMGKVKDPSKLTWRSFHIPETDQIIYTSILIPNGPDTHIKAKNMDELAPYVYKKKDSLARGRSYFQLITKSEILLPNFFWSQGKAALQLKMTKLTVLDQLECSKSALDVSAESELQRIKSEAISEFKLDERKLASNRGKDDLNINEDITNEADQYYTQYTTNDPTDGTVSDFSNSSTIISKRAPYHRAHTGSDKDGRSVRKSILQLKNNTVKRKLTYADEDDCDDMQANSEENGDQNTTTDFHF